MTCLTDYIGIRACATDTAPGSGIFINSLPGISLESIEKSSNADQITYKGLWADAQAEAATILYTDFITEITTCFSLQPYCDYENIICLNKKILLNAWKYLLGAQLMQFRIYTNRLNRYTTVDIEQAKELFNYYMAQYEKALHQAALLCDVSSCMLCCGGNPAVVTWLP